ncbi:MAG: DUF975 family protein [Lachnospiraceae bacterium]|nr:DUF975 family protein [Candidatus Merdinaster equi]
MKKERIQANVRELQDNFIEAHADRKSIKKAARSSVKKHYWAFVAVLVVAMIVGVSFTSGTRILNIQNYITMIRGDIVNVIYQVKEADTPSGEEVDMPEGTEGYVSKNFHLSDIIYQILIGDYELGLEQSEEVKEQNRNLPTSLFIGGVELHYNRGLLAATMNTISSEMVYVNLFGMLANVGRATDVGRVLLIVGATLLSAAVWFFLKRVYMVVYIRLFLEGRTYKCTPVSRLTFLIKTRTWFKVALALLWNSLWQFLWTLTIVGGIIKKFEYMMVPYILAENPSAKPKEALNLSKQMMKGHKWEAFCLEFSFLWWFLLDALTLGLVGIFYLYPYYQATITEYYSTVRKKAIEEKIPGYELLNDTYLFENPTDEQLTVAYKDVSDLINAGIPELPKRKGFQGFLENNLGIIIKHDEHEEQYREIQTIHAKIHHYRHAIKGEVYPVRMSPFAEIIKEKKLGRDDRTNFMRHYSLLNIAMIFFSCSVVGWIWEVSLHLVTDHQFVNRGVLHGPIIPIYGYGALISLTFLTRLRKSPVATFFAAVVLSGILEYCTAVALELEHGGEKWWDYSGYLLNIDGKVCAEGLLVFGIGCSAGIYILCPLIDSIFGKFNKKILTPIAIIFLCIYMTDNIYSTFVPNQGTGITDTNADIDNDEYKIGGQYSIIKQWIKNIPTFDVSDF